MKKTLKKLFLIQLTAIKSPQEINTIADANTIERCNESIRRIQEQIQQIRNTPENDTATLNTLNQCLTTLNNKRNGLAAETTTIINRIHDKISYALKLEEITEDRQYHSYLLTLRDSLKSFVEPEPCRILENTLDLKCKHLIIALRENIEKEASRMPNQIKDLVRDKDYDSVTNIIKKHNEKLKVLLEPVLSNEQIEELIDSEDRILRNIELDPEPCIDTINSCVTKMEEIKKYLNGLKDLGSVNKLPDINNTTADTILNYKIMAICYFKMNFIEQKLHNLICMLNRPPRFFPDSL